LITENDYGSELYNGDVGVIDQAADGKLVACFQQAGAAPGVRTLSLARLPAFTTVFAMTVHKSQGSEFDRVLVVLPHASSPLLNRELLYTAVTRAKRQVTLICSRQSHEVAVERRVERSSGLKTALGRGY
jgi:exodeoxyribonuclease V alpha subunit